MRREYYVKKKMVNGKWSIVNGKYSRARRKDDDRQCDLAFIDRDTPIIPGQSLSLLVFIICDMLLTHLQLLTIGYLRPYL